MGAGPGRPQRHEPDVPVVDRKRPFFLAEGVRPHQGQYGQGGGGRWGDAYAVLIEHGHRPEDIGRYTRRQVNLYLDRALARDRSKRRQLVSDVNAGFMGGKVAQEHLDKIKV